MKYIPAWKDKNGNRMLFLAPNHVFDTREAASNFQIGNFLFYIPLGLQPSGIVEMDLSDGKGQIPHVLCDGPMQSQMAVIEGPLFDTAITTLTNRGAIYSL